VLVLGSFAFRLPAEKIIFIRVRVVHASNASGDRRYCLMWQPSPRTAKSCVDFVSIHVLNLSVFEA